jgi:deoxyribonuclease-1
MAETYSVKLTTEERAAFEATIRANPVNKWELVRNRRIEAVQGNGNGYVD